MEAGAPGPGIKPGMPDSSAAPARLDLEIRMRDFGPMKAARMRLRPLTVFIGPNNSGKSYAALLAHSAVSLLGGGPRGALAASSRGARAGARCGRPGQARPPLKAGGRANEFLVTKGALGALSRDAGEAIAAAFSAQVEKNFGVDPSLLVRFGRARAAIEIPGIVEMAIPRSARGRPAPLGRPMNEARAREALAAEAADGIVARAKGEGVLACTLPADAGAASDAHSAYDRLLSRVLAAALAGQDHAVPAASIYLPAARASIMGARMAVQASAHGGAHEVPQAGPGTRAVDHEFPAAILDGGRRGQFSGIAGKLERDALQGRVALRRSARGAAPDVYYEQGREMPIRQASSAVSELAPLVLLLRHAARKGDLLVIEEPESHMHPEGQVALARCIVRLVREGLNVIVTTHSVYIVERFSSYLRAGSMAAAQRSRVGIDRGLYLEAGDMAPYLFEPGRGGTAVRPIDHSPREGMSQEEFMRVNEALHEENIRADKIVG